MSQTKTYDKIFYRQTTFYVTVTLFTIKNEWNCGLAKVHAIIPIWQSISSLSLLISSCVVCVQLFPLTGAVRHLFTPAEKSIPRVRIETRQSDVLAMQRILVALDSWPRNSRYPLGHFVRALGPIGEFVLFKTNVLAMHLVLESWAPSMLLQQCQKFCQWSISDFSIVNLFVVDYQTCHFDKFLPTMNSMIDQSDTTATAD